VGHHLVSCHLAVCPLLPKAIPTPFCKVYFNFDNENISGKLWATMFDVVSGPRMHKYLIQKYAWDTVTFYSIDCDSTHSAMKGLTIPEHRFTMIKLFFKLLPVGKLTSLKTHLGLKLILLRASKSIFGNCDL
jgi:hypothetical protein